MGPRTPTPQAPDATHFQPGSGSDPSPRPGPAPQGGKVLELGRAFVKTLRHFYLLQIAHLFLQMFEMGSLLRRLAQDYNTTPLGLFGSLKNIAKRLLECFRFFQLGDRAFEAGPGQIRLCDSA